MIERIFHLVVPAAVVENDGKRIAISDFDADRAAVFRDVFDDAL